MGHQSKADEVGMKIESVVSYMATDVIIDGFRIISLICIIPEKIIEFGCEDMLPRSLSLLSEGSEIEIPERGYSLKFPPSPLLEICIAAPDSTHGPRKEKREGIS